VKLWRISNHLSLSGEGGLRAPGRWHTRGRRVVYCAESPSSALLEALVHLELDINDLPARYRLIRISVPDALAPEELPASDLPPDWADRTDMTRALGDAWLGSNRSLLLAVPSAIIPETRNVLFNPSHSDASRVRIEHVGEHVVDPRLLTRRRL
jgi:RES domain-containing protein